MPFTTLIRNHTARYLAIAAFSCVLVQAQTPANNIVGYWEGAGTPNVSHLTHLNYAFASIVVNSSGSYTCQFSPYVNVTTLASQFQ